MTLSRNFSKKSLFFAVAINCFIVSAYWHLTNYTKDLTVKPFFQTSVQGSNDPTSAHTHTPVPIKSNACQCTSQTNRPAITEGSDSLCQYLTTDRGLRQKVVSYSLDGDVRNPAIFKKYFHAIDKIALQIKEIYPGWVMRIYHKYDATDIAFTKYICPVYCHYDHLDVCNVTDLERTSHDRASINISAIHSKMWRFTPIADPTVDIVLSRDIDSNVTTREREAVYEWLIPSNTTMHAMRDHPYHKETVMGGMWGARMDTGKREDLRRWFLKMKDEDVPLSNTPDTGQDQGVLVSLLYSLDKYDVVRHDSYYCTQYPKVTRPFPTQRVGYEFVGARIHDNVNRLTKCSPRCRPKDHKDWEYC